MASFIGTTGDDTQQGGSDADVFTYNQGGDDSLGGGGGDDIFRFGGAFTVGDRVNGATGNDTLVLQGDYAAGLLLDSSDLKSVETLSLRGAFTYNLQLGNGVVDAGGVLTIEALDPGAHLQLDASGENSYELDIHAAGGNNTRIDAGPVQTTITLDTVERSDVIDGGGGSHLFVTSAVSLKAAEHTFTGILHYHFASGSDVTLAPEDITGPGGFVYTGDGGTTRIDAHLVHFGPIDMFGGTGNDNLIGGQNSDGLWGGAGDDTLEGGLSADFLEGDAGDDVFVYRQVLNSTREHPDFLNGLDAGDRIDLSRMDADKTQGGLQHFTLVEAFDGHAGQLTLIYRAGQHETLLSGDVDGDGTADFRVAISDDHHDFTGLVLS